MDMVQINTTSHFMTEILGRFMRWLEDVLLMFSKRTEISRRGEQPDADR